MIVNRSRARVLMALSVVASMLVPLMGISAPAAHAAAEVRTSDIPEDEAHVDQDVPDDLDSSDGVLDQGQALVEPEAGAASPPSTASHLVPSLTLPADAVKSPWGVSPTWSTQPRDQTRIERSTTISPDFSASFNINATQGEYRWQMSVNDGRTWSDIAGTSRTYRASGSSAAPTLTLNDIWFSMDGNRYRIMITVDSGLVLYSDSALLTVLPGQVAINAHPSAQSAPEGGTAVFAARHGGASAPAEARWQRSDDGSEWTDIDGTRAPVAFNTETRLEVEAPFALDGTFYRAVFSNARTEAATNAARLTVVPALPVVSTHPEDVSVVEGEPVTFTSAYSGTDAPTSAQWQFSTDGGETFTYVPGGATDPDLSIDRATLGMDGWQYRVRYTNATGSRWSDPARLTVTVAQPVVSEHPDHVTVLEGETTTLHGAFTGTDAPTSAQWQFSTDGGQTFSDVPGGATDVSLTLAAVNREMDGWQYRVRFTNSVGSAWSDPATLDVTFTIPAAHGLAAPGESVELRIYDSAAAREGIMRIDAPSGTTISSVGHNGTGGADIFAISEDGTSATTSAPDLRWGGGGRTAWVTLTVDDDVAPGTVLVGGTATVTSATGIVRAQADLSVTVTGEIEVLEHPADVTVDVGTSAKFSTIVSGHGVSTQWQVSADEGTTWVDVDGGTGTTLTLEATTPEMSRSWYRAVHTNSAGQVVTDHAVLLVRVAPHFVTHPHPELLASPGTLAHFAGWASDNIDGMRLTWEYSADGETWAPYEDGIFPGPPTGLNALQLWPVLAQMDGFQFRAVAENHLGTAVSTPGLLTVGAAPVIDSQPADRRVFEGGTATFVASTPAVSPHRTQQWQERVAGGDWVDIPGATEATYTTVPATREMDQREYRVVFTNRHGSTESDPAVLIVFEPVEASVLLTPTARLVDQIR